MKIEIYQSGSKDGEAMIDMTLYVTVRNLSNAEEMVRRIRGVVAEYEIIKETKAK